MKSKNGGATPVMRSFTPDELLQAEFEKLVHGGVYHTKDGQTTPFKLDQIPPAAFVPISSGQTTLTADLNTMSAKTFLQIVEAFNDQTKKLGQLPPLNLPNGWYNVGPAFAEYLLRRNRPDANREPGLGTVQYYHRQMKKGDWKPTGEAIILDDEGWKTNGQHRCWAALLGKVCFPTYIVTDAPAMANCFVYLDNVKVRNAAEALKTAKMNGTSSLVAKVVNMSVNYDVGVYTCAKKRKSERLSPNDVLTYVSSHPLTRRAAHLVAAEYKSAISAVGHDDVVAFLAFKLLSGYGDEICDQFMEELEYNNEQAPDNDPGRAIRLFLSRQKKTSDPLPKHMVLAYLIKGFNLWVQRTPVKYIKVAADDDYPTFVEPSVAGMPETESQPEPEVAGV